MNHVNYFFCDITTLLLVTIVDDFGILYSILKYQTKLSEYYLKVVSTIIVLLHLETSQLIYNNTKKILKDLDFRIQIVIILQYKMILSSKTDTL